MEALDFLVLSLNSYWMIALSYMQAQLNKANLRDLIAATGLVILLKLDSNRQFFSPCDLEIWWMTLKNNRALLLHCIKLCASSIGKFKPELQSGNAQLGLKKQFCFPCDLKIWWMTSKKNRAPLLYYVKLCASFQNHGWIQTGVTVQISPIWVKIDNFFVPCDLEIWWMILKNNRTPLLYPIKLCVSFQSRPWIETEVTIRKPPIRAKIGDFFTHVTLKFDGWPWKTIGHLFYVASSFVHHFIAITELKLEH